MQRLHLNLFQPLNQRLQSLEEAMTRPANTFTFLLIRFLLMSAMVVGFSWWALQLSP
jgi:predicted Na+-dependent transporter